jgi:hypothetical protein
MEPYRDTWPRHVRSVQRTPPLPSSAAIWIALALLALSIPFAITALGA